MALSDVLSPWVALRHTPPRLGPGIVLRARLIEAVRQRFDRRLTVIVGGAGFGKTTLLTQAVHENRLERRGIDAWLRVEPTDRDPTHLLAALARSVTGTDGPNTVDLDELVDLVWSAAPEAVALILDDVHLLDEADAAWAVVLALLERLPANGSMVLSGRRPPPIATRLLLDDAVLVLDESELAFTDDELRAFAAERSLPPELAAALPPWPALATLRAAAGRGASTSFLWEEVLGALPADRQRLLALAAHFDVIDDGLVRALDPATTYSAADLVIGLPLVQTDGEGSFRLHALWSDALIGRVDLAERQAVLAAAARILLDAGAGRRAAEAAALAGDREGLHRAICRVVGRPIASVSVPDVIRLYELLPPDMRSAPIGALLDAALCWEASLRQATTRFSQAVEQARLAGDDAVEALARWHAVQLHYLDDHDDLVLDPRLDELAATGVPLARSTPAFIRSVIAQREGRVADAIAALDDLDGSDPDQRRATVTARMIDLGRPEAVATSVDALFGPWGIDFVSAQALVLRGEVEPDAAWTIGWGLASNPGRKLQDAVSVRSVVAVLGTITGHLDEAEQLVAQVVSSREIVGRQVAALAAIGAAAVALCRDGEAAAIAELRSALAYAPLGRFPARAHLYALTPLRALLPEHAEVLDGLDLGPSLALAVAAGRAVAELRSTGDPTLARALPWTQVDLLRYHVPPPLLAELALAAALDGDAAPSAVLDRLPHRRRWLERVAARHTGRLRTAAAARLGTLPARPDYEVHVTTFGGLTVRRSDGGTVDDGRMQRERVRQILAHLLLRTRSSRPELAAALWPDLPADKASSNLRTNLRHLQLLLQPDRGPRDASWFVQVDGEAILLTTEGLVVDCHRFDDHVRRAVAAESSGLPSLALVEYEAASALYTGDFLPGLDDQAVDVERLRLRSLAQSARCRAGELTLAHGEPEAAMHAAANALRLDPLSERAHRLFMRCHVALGSSGAAREAGARLLAALAADRLEPEDETVRLLSRIQATASAS